MVVLKPDLRSPTYLDASVDTADVDGEMWQRLNDPALAELVTEAVSESRDLDQASARLRKARANRDAARARSVPANAAVARWVFDNQQYDV